MDKEPIRGVANIVEEPDRVVPPGPPHTYLGMARVFLTGAQALAESNSSVAIPLAFLGAQSAECALKAYLSRGDNDRRLKENPQLRHDLVAL